MWWRVNHTSWLLLLFPILAAPQQLHAGHISPLSHNVNNNHHNNVKSTDSSAMATLALADNAAVRAPSGSSSAPLAPSLDARSIQDWNVEDIVLLATVDGSIHARDRKTGAPRWALDVPNSPMVESIYHRSNRSALEQVRPEEDFLWIVEPSKDGSIYVYRPQPSGGLQKLGLTVKELVNETPYSGTDPAVTYTARKETTVYTIDARTGAVLRVFSSSQGPLSSSNQDCPKVNGDSGMLEDDDCESSTSGTLVLGRVEYAVAIQNTDTGSPVCTLKYSEWTTNARDTDLQSQYYRSMDQSHVYSMHDGVVLGYDHSDIERPRYTQRFSSPVIRVFDVLASYPHDEDDDGGGGGGGGGGHGSPRAFVVLSQPLQPPDPTYASVDGRESRVFIDRTEAGGWYAMSEETYPLVTGRAKLARCYEKDYFQNNERLMSLTPTQQRDALVGVHSLSSNPGVSDIGRSNMPSISGPPAASSAAEIGNSSPSRGSSSSSSSELTLPPGLRHSTIIRKGWDNAVDIFVTLLFMFFSVIVYFNSHHLQELAKEKLDLKNVLAAYGSQPTPLSAPPTPVVATAPWRPDDDPVGSMVDDADGVITPRPKRDRSSVIVNSPRVRIQEPPVEEEDREKPQQKKARRGRRGGRAHKRGKKGDDDAKSQTDRSPHPPHEDTDDTAAATPRARSVSRLGRAVSHEIVEVGDNVIQIGRLQVFTDVVLGHGSHGTVVYRGSFDGRDVAVKRMLVEFYDIASQEVTLLQESDDHKNVIRYFCREETAGFLYIALELCPASLQDIIEPTNNQVAKLVKGGLDMPDILRQITAGVRYLHSLKIVHRDLKPQNILVAMPRGRSGSTTTALRLLISDFGLCKKLEDNQSSFRATTAHAAGTSGWRAPELLVDEDKRHSAVGESQNTESSEPAVVDPQTNRRATRAIDIFSLGCVFFYVLTRGCHPFDKNGKFMREANIIKGEYNLDELQLLGDYAFEADDLIRSMLSLDPRQRYDFNPVIFSPSSSCIDNCRRPDATGVLMHPFFWNSTERLNFLCDVSDHFEFEPRDPPSEALLCLESVARRVMGPDMDFLRHLPKDFKDNLGKQRKYNGCKMLDLLRALRNKRNHYNDMPEPLKHHIGGLPEGYLLFWTVRFPSLLMSCHWTVVHLGLANVDRFRRYFSLPDDLGAY